MMPSPTQADMLIKGVQTLTDEVHALKKTIESLQSETAEIRSKAAVVADDVKATKELVQAWAAVKTGGRFLIWVGKVMVALGAVWVVFRSGVLALWVR